MLEVRMSKLVKGIGINDKSRPARVNTKRERAYTLWVNMLVRTTKAYWDKFPTYIGVEVSDNFKSYSYFYDWCQEQVGFNNNSASTWQLDKDLLIKGNKLYGEDTCVFVPKEINFLLLGNNVDRGDCPIGVYLNKRVGRYVASCCIGAGETQSLGYYETKEGAFQAYKKAKEAYIKVVADNWKQDIDFRVYQALINYRVEITD